MIPDLPPELAHKVEAAVQKFVQHAEKVYATEDGDLARSSVATLRSQLDPVFIEYEASTLDLSPEEAYLRLKHLQRLRDMLTTLERSAAELK